MTLDALRELLDYHYWARDRLLAAVERLSPDELTRDLGNSFGSVRDTLAHIYGAEWVWRSRWEGTSPEAIPSGDAFPDVATLRRAWSAHEQVVRRLLEDLGSTGVGRVMAYRSLDGVAHRSAFWRMLQHVVNHASYHRGQVTTLLRQLGAAPPASMDLVTFHRERDAAS